MSVVRGGRTTENKHDEMRTGEKDEDTDRKERRRMHMHTHDPYVLTVWLAESCC